MAKHKLTMHETATYCIRIQGAFNDSWLQNLGADWTIQQENVGPAVTTTITGVMCDQAGLMGLLGSLYNVGLPLLNVEYLEATAGQAHCDE